MANEDYFLREIKAACSKDFLKSVGEKPNFEYEVHHIEDDEFWQAVVMFQGRDVSPMGSSWTGVAYFRYPEVPKDADPWIAQVTQFIEGEPYTFDVSRPPPQPELDQEGNRLLSEKEWDALEKAEQSFWKGTGAPVSGWTGVNVREDSGYIAKVWDDCLTYVENSYEYAKWEDLPKHVQDQNIANRVARVNAVIVYGPEILLR